MVTLAEGLDTGQVQNIAGHVRRVVADEPFRPRCQPFFHGVILQGAAGTIAGDESQGYALGFQLVKRPQDGIVFPRRRQNAVAGMDEPFEDHVQGCRRVMRKGDIVFRAAVEQGLYIILGLQDDAIGLQGVTMGPAGRVAHGSR